MPRHRGFLQKADRIACHQSCASHLLRTRLSIQIVANRFSHETVGMPDLEGAGEHLVGAFARGPQAPIAAPNLDAAGRCIDEAASIFPVGR